MDYQEKADAQAAATGSAPSAASGQLLDIGEVSSHNIALTLRARGIVLEDDAIPVIKSAIRDEIQAMSSHFTLAMADVMTQHETAEAKAEEEVARIKSTYTYVEANIGKVVAVLAGVFAIGVAVGAFV